MFPWDITNSVFLLDMTLGTILTYTSIVIFIYFNHQISKQKISLALLLIAWALAISAFLMKKIFVERSKNGFIKQRMKIWFYLRSLVLWSVIVWWTLVNIAGPIERLLDNYSETEKVLGGRGHQVQDEGRRVLYASGYEGSLLEEVFCRLMHIAHCLLYIWFLVWYWYAGKMA
jgi:hypothetical protein